MIITLLHKQNVTKWNGWNLMCRGMATSNANLKCSKRDQSVYTNVEQAGFQANPKWWIVWQREIEMMKSFRTIGIETKTVLIAWNLSGKKYQKQFPLTLGTASFINRKMV